MSYNLQPILDFLELLAENNNKAWLDQNRDQYQAARNEWIGFVEELLPALAEINPIFMEINAKKCIYRINRDLRFSKNKTPYKKNFGAFFVPQGKSSGNAGYYIHIEPGNCFIAGGIRCPDSQRLFQIRERISKRPKKLLEAIDSPDFQRYFKDIKGKKLKRAPRGFDPEDSNIELLKLKGFIVRESISDKFILKTTFLNNIMERFRAMQSFVEYLN